MTPLYVWILIGSVCHGPVLKVCEPVEVYGPFQSADECMKAAAVLPPIEAPRVCERRAG